MSDRLSIKQNVSVEVVHSKRSEKMEKLDSKLQPKGHFIIEHLDKFGKLKRAYKIPNGIVNVGKNFLLDVMFSDETPVGSSSWYVGLIDSSGFTALSDSDTMSSHSGWSEFTTYSESTRVAWGPGAAASQSITNATPATFNISGSGTVKGVFIVSNNTKGGTTGYLWATALFTAEVPVGNGDQLKITYTVSA